MNRLLAILVFSLFSFSFPFFISPAQAGVVRTLDGRVYQGPIVIDPGGYLLVNQANGAAIKIQLEELLEASFVDHPQEASPQRGVALTDGTVLASDRGGPTIKDSTVTCVSGDRRIDVPIDRVARVLFGPLTARQWAKIPPGKTGAVMANGDFFQGDFKGEVNGQVKISSVLFGIQQFTEGDQAHAVVLADVHPGTADFIVRFSDGSVFLAKSLELDAGRLVVEDQSLGIFSADAHGVLSIRYGPGKLASLADMKPLSVVPDEDGNMVVDGTTSGVAMDFTDASPSRGIGVTAGTTVTYALDGKYGAFICRAGLPVGLAPSARLRFIVLVDGKEAFRSAGQTSVDDSAAICLSVAGARSLSLRVEAVQGGALGASAVWGDPSLLKAQ